MFTWLSTGRALRARLDQLEKRVDELEAALEQNRREFGKLWRRFRDTPELEESETGDPKLDAILRAQRSGPAGPREVA